MVYIDERSGNQHGRSNKQTQEDADLIEKVQYIVSTAMINTFAPMNNTNIVNITTGEEIPSENIIFAEAKGIAAMKRVQEAASAKIISPEI